MLGRGKKHGLSRYVTSAKGAKDLEEYIGKDSTEFLASINSAISKFYGEKVAKQSKDDTYRMLAKFGLISAEEKEDKALRLIVDKALNFVARQAVIALKTAPSNTDYKEAEVASMSAGLTMLGTALVDLATEHMRPKNLATLKRLIEQLSSLKFLSSFFYEKKFEDERKKMLSILDRMFQDLMELTGEIFSDTLERREKAKAEGKKDTQKKPSMFGGNDEKKKMLICAVVSCGAEIIYAEKEFGGSPLCIFHHFKAFPDFNQVDPPNLKAWMSKADRRSLFQKFLEASESKQLVNVKLYGKIKELQEAKKGNERSELALTVLKILIDTAGSQMTEGIRQKIKSMISENDAPARLFDNVIPNLVKLIGPVYTKEFSNSSLYKTYLQKVRMTDAMLEELAYEITSRQRGDKSSGPGELAFAKTKTNKKRPKIDVNAVLQPFAQDKDRSPTIRRVKPTDSDYAEEVEDGTEMKEGKAENKEAKTIDEKKTEGKKEDKKD
mmetsp:Transcript_1169/g.1630  ORF Transcript_1169/g.1630 Transcript_1169/m.1630 type:complete len:496 (-) Transcript_1169:176-1663(-)